MGHGLTHVFQEYPGVDLRGGDRVVTEGLFQVEKYALTIVGSNWNAEHDG